MRGVGKLQKRWRGIRIRCLVTEFYTTLRSHKMIRKEDACDQYVNSRPSHSDGGAGFTFSSMSVPTDQVSSPDGPIRGYEVYSPGNSR